MIVLLYTGVSSATHITRADEVNLHEHRVGAVRHPSFHQALQRRKRRSVGRSEVAREKFAPSEFSCSEGTDTHSPSLSMMTLAPRSRRRACVEPLPCPTLRLFDWSLCVACSPTLPPPLKTLDLSVDPWWLMLWPHIVRFPSCTLRRTIRRRG
ncbi:hypothetical protein BV20DRAFT_475471 [Pilatotrama ljubarskyi]|nr:hypothetical protein BV20DRAFT_475471 [Pilatotrama ljubarskyi]